MAKRANKSTKPIKGSHAIVQGYSPVTLIDSSSPDVLKQSVIKSIEPLGKRSRDKKRYVKDITLGDVIDAGIQIAAGALEIHAALHPVPDRVYKEYNSLAEIQRMCNVHRAYSLYLNTETPGKNSISYWDNDTTNANRPLYRIPHPTLDFHIWTTEQHDVYVIVDHAAEQEQHRITVYKHR